MIKIFPVILLTFVNILGFSVLIPVLPFIVRDLGFNEFIYGVLISCYSGFQFIGAPLLGQLSDRYGRKPMLIVSQAGTLLAWVLMAFAWWLDQGTASNLVVLLVLAGARIFDGITGGNNSVAGAYLSDVVPKEKKQVAFGFVGATIGVGMIVGPAIGAFTSKGELGYLGVILFSIVLSSITLFSIIFSLKESVIEKNDAPLQLRNRFLFWRAIKSFKNNQMVIIGIKARFFVSATMASYTSVIVLLLIDQFSFTITEVGNFLFFVGGFFVVNQMMVKYFSNWWGEKNILWLGPLLMAVGLYLFPPSTNIYWFVILYYIANLGISISIPTIKSIISNHTDSTRQGEVMGLDDSILAISMAVCPMLSGLAYQAMGFKSLWITATFSLIGSVVIYRSLKKMKLEQEEDKQKEDKQKKDKSNPSMKLERQ